jgi:hypothetical protein
VLAHEFFCLLNKKVGFGSGVQQTNGKNKDNENDLH